jgi:alpha-D-ribose 1-methylphosphonate 5-triphosphate synthase subunit PhnL
MELIAPVKVAVSPAVTTICSISSKLAAVMLLKSVDVMTRIWSLPPAPASVMDSPEPTSPVKKL